MGNNDKSLMKNIANDVNEIKKAKKFGPKLPSSEDELTKKQIQSVSYEQMIMGTLSSLVWGKRNISKDQQVKALLGSNTNIFNLIENFTKSWEENFLNSYNGYILESIEYIEDINKNIGSLITTLQSIDERQKLIFEETKKSSKSNESSIQDKAQISIIIGADNSKKSSIVDFLENFCDSKKFNKNSINNIKDNLKELSDIISNPKVSNSLKNIFKSVSDIMKDYNIENNLNNLDIVLSSIISIITVDKDKLSLDGIRLLRKITDPKHGYLYDILCNIEEITKNININDETIVAIKDFIDGIISICEIKDYSFSDLLKIALKLELIQYIIGSIIIGDKENKNGIIYLFSELNTQQLTSIANKITLLGDIFDNITNAFDKLPTIKSLIITAIKFKIIALAASIIKNGVEKYDEIIKELLKIKLTEANKKKIDNIIDTIIKLANIKISISNIISLNLALNLLNKSVNKINEIISSLNEIDPNNLKAAISTTNNFNKLVLISAAVLITGSLAMKFINPLDLVAFTLCLGGFVWGLSKIYKIFSKNLGDATLESVDQFAKLVAISVATLLVGSLAFKYLAEPSIKFTILLSLFIGAVTFAYTIAVRNKETFESADKFAKLIAISALTLMIGSLFMLDNKLAWGAIKFAGLLVVFIGLINLSFRLLPKDTKNVLQIMTGLSIIIAVSAGILMLGGLFMMNDKLAWGAIKFALLLAGFIVVMSLIAVVLNNFEKYIKSGVIIMGMLVLVTAGMAVAITMVALVSRIIPKDIWSKLLVMGAVIIGLAVICGIIGIPKVALCVGIGIVVMIGLIAVIMLMSVAFVVLTAAIQYMNKIDDKSIKTAFGNMGDVLWQILTNIGPKLIGLSVEFPFMLPGIIALFTLSAALSMVARTIKLWADLRIPIYDSTGTKIIGTKSIVSEDFNTAAQNIKTVVGLMFDTVKDVYESGKNNGLFEFNLRTFLTGKTPAEIVISSTMNLGKMLTNLAQGIQSWADLKIPIYDNKGKIVGYKTIDDDAFDNAAQHIKKVVVYMGQAIADIYDDIEDNPNTKGMFESDEWLGLGRTKFSKVVNAMKTMGPMLQSVAKGIQAWADLRVPQYNSKGEIIGYQSLKERELTKAGDNIKTVLVCIGQSITETVSGHEEIFGDTLFKESPAIIAAKAMKIMADVLNLSAMGIASYASGKFPLFDKDGKFVDYITVKPEDYVLAAQHIEEVLTCIGNALVNIVNKDKSGIFEEGLFTDSPAAVAAEAIKNISEALNNTITAIKQLSELKLDDLIAALDPNGKNNVYTKLQSLIGFTIDIFKLFAAQNENTDKKRALWGIGWQLGENRSFAEYLDAHNGDIEDAADALETFTSTIKKLLSRYAEIGKFVTSNNKSLIIFDGGINSSIFKNLSAYLDTTIMIIGKFIDENIVDKLEDFEDKTSDIKKGIDSVISVTKTLLNGIVSIKKISENIDDFNLYDTLNPIISSFNNCIGILQNIGQSNIDLNGQIGNFKLDILNSNAKEFNENIKLYTDALKLIIDVNEYARKSDENGFAKHVKTLDKYVKVINSIKLTNINSLRGFVDSMNELSNKLGNLDNLTDAIGNKLSQVLYELVLQLRKAEATIENAHELQEKRKKLMEESIGKMKDILNQHMIVEIYQTSDEEQLKDNVGIGRINNNEVHNTDSNSSSPNSSSKSGGNDLPNPDNAKLQKVNSGNKDMEKYEKSMTFFEFTKYMENDFLNLFRNSG